MGKKENQQQPEEEIIKLVIKSIGNTTTEHYKADGLTPLELLKQRHEVKTSLNDYIKCIDNVCVGNEYGWSLYVNNEYINYAPDTYKIKRGDTIGFEFRKGG